MTTSCAREELTVHDVLAIGVLEDTGGPDAAILRVDPGTDVGHSVDIGVLP